MIKQPIALFDSGLGGLTVLKVVAQAFPNEDFVYLGDLARLPYGNKSPETIRNYGEQVLDFLLQFNPRALVIACNTASTVFMGQSFFKNVPLINVIGPGSEAALRQSKTKNIAVLATSTTVGSHAYQREIQRQDPKATVQELACPLFVPLAEEGWANDPITESVAKKYLAGLSAVDTIVLGCTHYPILKSSIQKVVGKDVTLIESGEVVVEKLKELIPKSKLDANRNIHLYTTDITAHFQHLSEQLMAPLKTGPLERIDL